MRNKLNNRHKIIQLARKNGKEFFKYCKKKGELRSTNIYDKWDYTRQEYIKVKELIFQVNDYVADIIINLKTGSIIEWSIHIKE